MRPQQTDNKGDRLNVTLYDGEGDPIAPIVTIHSDIGGFSATLITFDGRKYTTGKFYPTKRQAAEAVHDYAFGFEIAKGWLW
jgi:hypothetical protein